MITALDRLLAASRGEPPDRIPVFCNMIDQGALELGLPIHEYYSKGEYVAEGQLRMRAKYDYDNLWSLFYVGKEAEILGCKRIVFASGGPPNVGDMIIKTHKDIETLQIPEDLTGHPAMQEPMKCLEILRAEAAGKYPICAYITASMTLPVLLMGMEKWLDLLLNGPIALRDELLEKCSLFCAREIAAYRAAGANVIVYSNPFGSTDIIPYRMVDEVSSKWMSKDLAEGGMDGVVYYCGGARLEKTIDLAISRHGFQTLYLGPSDDIAVCKRNAAGRALTVGVINDIQLIDWSEDEIQVDVQRILKAGMAGGKFMFGTILMPFGIPEKNIRAMLAAAFRYGRYAP
jgi:uroporphyrinogen decarboxylase